jgi:microcystin synthetase protein McyA
LCPASRSVAIADAVHDGLKALADATGVSLKDVLLAAHVRVLGAATGQAEIVTGLMSNGRLETDEGERVAGMFLNVLPFHAPLSNASWPDFVGRVAERARELLPYRRFALPHARRRVADVAFDTLFNYTHFHVYRGLAQSGGLQLLGAAGFEHMAFALVANFTVEAGAAHMALRLDYNANALDAATIDAIAGAYVDTLAAAASVASPVTVSERARVRRSSRR